MFEKTGAPRARACPHAGQPKTSTRHPGERGVSEAATLPGVVYALALGFTRAV